MGRPTRYSSVAPFARRSRKPADRASRSHSPQRVMATEHRRESVRRITLSVFAMHEGTAHDRRGQVLVDDLGELADDFDFHHDPRLAPRKAQDAITSGSPKDVARSKRQY